MAMLPLGQADAQAVQPQQSCGSVMMMCRISLISGYKVCKNFLYLPSNKNISQGRVRFPTGGDSPRLPDNQGLNR